MEYYLQILNKKQKDFIETFINALQSGAINKELQQDMIAHLTSQPYPFLQVLCQCQSTIGSFVEQILVQALRILITTDGTEVTMRLASLLVNLPTEIWRKISVEEILMDSPTLLSSSDEVYAALLGHPDKQLLSNIQEKLKVLLQNYQPNALKEFILYQAVENKMHFAPLLYNDLKEPLSLTDNIVSNNLIIASVIDAFSAKKYNLPQITDYLNKCLKAFQLSSLPADWEAMHRFFYADFARQQLICDFVLKHTNQENNINIYELIGATSLLQLVHTHSIDVSFDETLNTLKSISQWQRKLYAKKTLHDQEKQILIHYTCLLLVYDLVVKPINERNQLEFINNKVQQLNGILRQVHYLETVCNILEDTLQLVFLRWEYLNMKFMRNKRDHKSDCSSDNNSAVEQPVLPTSGLQTTYGFICSGDALHALFSMLKNFGTNKMHSEDYKQSLEIIQQRFKRIMQVVNEALWKYTIVEKIEKSLAFCSKSTQNTLEPEELLQLVQSHRNMSKEKSSSEDDSRDRCGKPASLNRRKISFKKHRRATFSGAACTAINNVVTTQSIDTDAVNRLKTSNLMGRFTDRGVIPKMLATTDDLATMALSLKDFETAKFIIKIFKLENSYLNRELLYVEQLQQTRKKLEEICLNFQHQQSPQPTKPPLDTVQHIKLVAARGFEMSKIINIIGNFAQAHGIKQSEDIKQLLAKQTNNAPYAQLLQQLREENLFVVPILDLMLNLPLNVEMVANIMSVLRKQQETFPNYALGMAPFLEHMYSCMRCLPDKTLENLLCDNYYSLNPQQLELELQREQIFTELFKQSVANMRSYEDLRVTNTLFQSLAAKKDYYLRLVFYVRHLQKLLHLRDKNLQYHTDELLKLNVCDLIGELIFEQQMTPLEIENIVMSLNLNLVHVIALNICPEMVFKKRGESQVKRTLSNYSILCYIKNQNELLATLLQGICAESAQSVEFSAFAQFLQLPEIKKYSELFNGNSYIAALLSDKVSPEFISKLPNKRQQLDIFLLQLGNIDNKQRHMRAVDELVESLINEDAKNIELVSYINNLTLRAQLIKNHFTRLSTTRLAQHLIENTLQHKQALLKIPSDLFEQLKCILSDITVYAEVSAVLTFESWPQAYNFALKSPQSIFEQLLQQQYYELCYKWCLVVKLSTYFSQYTRSFLQVLLQALLQLRDDSNQNNEALKYLLLILETFPAAERLRLLQEHKENFRSLCLLEYTFQALTNNSTLTYTNYKVSLIILEQLSLMERSALWHLIKYPLLMLEQLLMNAKFELLGKVLTNVRQFLNLQVNNKVCAYCFDKQGHQYDTHTKSLRAKADNSAFILLNFNLYQQDHVLSTQCIDLLLRIYATKALDYNIYETSAMHQEQHSSTTETQLSIDSLSDTFQMPPVAPTRADWVHDEDASHCMCCRSVAFSMLIRRHHCRRCGRVVCHNCSMQRTLIPELYAQVKVRICDDCKRLVIQNCEESCEATQMIIEGEQSRKPSDVAKDLYKWQLSGNITHDKLLREEFCFDHAPSVALCLSILDFHVEQTKCVQLLLYHCRQLEKLIVPNPEVDYELVAKMMNCLALAAKVRGGPAEVEHIREHSEIIVSVVQNGCESLIPPGEVSNHSLRKLADCLVQAEKYDLALDVHLKCGFPTAGVMAAHGLSCLKAGCFNLARDKFVHCMTKISDDQTNAQILAIVLRGDISLFSKDNHLQVIKRPKRGPALLQEILKVIELCGFVMPHPETIKRATVIRNSNTSIVSMLSRRKETFVVPLHEPALNILTTLANLKHISKGDYNQRVQQQQPQQNFHTLTKQQKALLLRQTHGYNECLFYLLSYGSHTDVLQFFMRHNDLSAVLFYCLAQQLDPELFVQNVFLIYLRNGQVEHLVEEMLALDSSCLLWRHTFLQTCRYLETKGLFNSLYQLQVLLKDPIRASMTCVKFYTMHCENFQQLQANAVHLRNATRHMKEELECTSWTNISLPNSNSRRSSMASNGSSFPMQLDARVLNNHINTILKQLEVTKFLSTAEKENKFSEGLITIQILKQIRIETVTVNLPTLFDGTREKIEICILVLYCGKNVEEGYGLSYSIIQDYKLPALKVFASTAKYLARNKRLSDVEKLIGCISGSNGVSTRDIDEILSVAINECRNIHEPEVKLALDNLTKKINSIEMRISSNIFIGQLKSAYLLANKYERISDIRRILRQAELSNQPLIKKLCQKKLESQQKTLSSIEQKKQ